METKEFFTPEEKKLFASKYKLLLRHLYSFLEREDVPKMKELMKRVVALDCYGRDKNDALIPTCGFGDYLYYAMWISGTHALSSSGISYAFVAFMVCVGTILQSIAVKLFSKRDGFKGFPGTVFPFLCTVLAYFVLYYQVL